MVQQCMNLVVFLIPCIQGNPCNACFGKKLVIETVELKLMKRQVFIMTVYVFYK